MVAKLAHTKAHRQHATAPPSPPGRVGFRLVQVPTTISSHTQVVVRFNISVDAAELREGWRIQPGRGPGIRIGQGPKL